MVAHLYQFHKNTHIKLNTYQWMNLPLGEFMVYKFYLNKAGFSFLKFISMFIYLKSKRK